MPTRRVPSDPLMVAVVTKLANTTAVTGLATGGIYDNVPQTAEYPYVVVESVTMVIQDTYGRKGGNSHLQVRVVSQYRGGQEADRIRDQVIRALDYPNPMLPVSGHTMLGLNFRQSEDLKTVINGIPTREWLALFDAWTEQSTS